MKSNKKQTIIFDMDGVLIDASNSFRVAAADTYKHYSGFELPLEEVSKLKKSGGHNNDWDMVEYLLGKINITVNKDELVEYFENIYKENESWYVKCEEESEWLKWSGYRTNL